METSQNKIHPKDDKDSNESSSSKPTSSLSKKFALIFLALLFLALLIVAIVLLVIYGACKLTQICLVYFPKI